MEKDLEHQVDSLVNESPSVETVQYKLFDLDIDAALDEFASGDVSLEDLEELLSEIPAIETAAELPDIEGFSKDDEKEIKRVLALLPSKVFHYVDVIKSDESLNAIHGKYDSESKTILINPSNFEHKGQFGTGENKVDLDVFVMAHECFHALWESLTEEEQKEWLDLSGWMKGTKAGQAPAYVEKRPGWPHKRSKWTHCETASFCRTYSSKSPYEDFSDTGAYYVTKNDDNIPRKKLQFIQRFV